jgi:tRNA pseudouridine13 synthase
MIVLLQFETAMIPYPTDFAYLEGKPTLSGHLSADDFQVDEQLHFTPTGEGEHVLLQIRKRHTNTDWLAGQLAKLAKVKPVDVSYAGLKDRHAITTQWFSVRLVNQPEPQWQLLAGPDIDILQSIRHSRKLRRGALQANHFVLTLRNLTGDFAELEHRLQAVQQGVPNYFGAQRFGHHFENLSQVEAMFNGVLKVRDRHKRSLYLSSARSLLFNLVLSERVKTGQWNQAIPGDVMQLANSHALFVIDDVDSNIVSRLANFDIHPTGPLWGRGPSMTHGLVAELETQILSNYTAWCLGLEEAGMQQERRALRLVVQDFQWEFLEATTLQLRFQLVAGAYATTVLREVVNPV